MGAPKARLPWGETTVLGQVVLNLWAGGVEEVIVVTTGHDRWTPNQGIQARIVLAPGGPIGTMTQSIQAGIRSLEPACRALLVLLADQPMIEPDVIRSVVNAHVHDGYDLVAASHRGRRGHPVLFGRRYFGELLSLLPNEAPRAVIDRYREDLRLVEFESDAVLADLDTPEAYAKWRVNLSRRPITAHTGTLARAPCGRAGGGWGRARSCGGGD